MGIKRRATETEVTSNNAQVEEGKTEGQETTGGEERREDRRDRREDSREDRRDRRERDDRDERRERRDSDEERRERRERERENARRDREDRERREREEREEEERTRAKDKKETFEDKPRMNLNIGNAYSSSRNNQRVNRFNQLHQEWKKANSSNQLAKMQEEAIKTFPIPGMENLGPVSLLATVGTFDNDPKFYYSLIVVENRESTVREVTRRNNDRRRDRDEIREYISMGEQLDDKTLTSVEETLCSLHSALSISDMRYCGYVVLSHGVSLDTVDEILPILGTATDYILTAAGLTRELFDADFKADGIKLEGIIGIVGTSDVAGYAGLPIRNDISISLETSQTGNNRSTSLIDNTSQAQWATASGYIDLLPVESPDSTRDDRSKDHNLACLLPRMVFSEIDVYREEESAGPMVRSMIAASIAVNLDKAYRYFRCFMPTAFSSRDRDIRDLGYLMDPQASVEPGKLDMENPEDDQQVFEVLKRLVRHSLGMEFAYRYNEGMPGSSFGELLRDIYEDRSNVAREHLFDLLDDATNNYFTDEFDRLKGRDVIAAAFSLPDGHYMTNNGPQPVTRLDHWFAASKFQDRDTQRLDDYIRAHSSTSGLSNDERVGIALDLYKHLSGDTFKMTGICTVMIFDPLFMEACYAAFHRANMELQVNRDRDEVRGRRGERASAHYGLRYDEMRGAGRNNRRSSDRRGRGDRDNHSRTRNARW